MARLVDLNWSPIAIRLHLTISANLLSTSQGINASVLHKYTTFKRFHLFLEIFEADEGLYANFLNKSHICGNVAKATSLQKKKEEL